MWQSRIARSEWLSSIRRALPRAIVGDLLVQGDLAKWEMHRRADGAWLLDAQIPIGDFKELFEIADLPQEDEARFNTLAGFILSQLERVTLAGEAFVWKKLRFEIVDLDRHQGRQSLGSK